MGIFRRCRGVSRSHVARVRGDSRERVQKGHVVNGYRRWDRRRHRDGSSQSEGLQMVIVHVVANGYRSRASRMLRN